MLPNGLYYIRTLSSFWILTQFCDCPIVITGLQKRDIMELFYWFDKWPNGLWERCVLPVPWNKTPGGFSGITQCGYYSIYTSPIPSCITHQSILGILSCSALTISFSSLLRVTLVVSLPHLLGFLPKYLIPWCDKVPLNWCLLYLLLHSKAPFTSQHPQHLIPGPPLTSLSKYSHSCSSSSTGFLSSLIQSSVLPAAGYLSSDLSWSQ